MSEKEEQVFVEVTGSIYDCIDFINLLLNQYDLNKNISAYLGALRILNRELLSNIDNLNQLNE
ncbi:hypothetical protein [[Eubacterium] hominis]|uniref:hypothetical protein n=1 Tax=[Eubacterium] hominis TaxID=2764325 RepID=UPI003A4DEF94